MSKWAQNCRPLKPEMPCTASWRLLLLRRCICSVLPHWYLPPLSWSHQWTRAWPFKLVFWPTHRKKLQRLQSGECRGQENSKSHKMILSPLSKFRMVYQHWAVAPSCCQTMTWPVTDELLPDHERIYQWYWWHQGWPARYLHHPFHNQPLSIYEPNKLMSSLCYAPVSNVPPYLWDTMAPRRRHIFNCWLGWKGYLLLSLTRSGTRRL